MSNNKRNQVFPQLFQSPRQRYQTSRYPIFGYLLGRLLDSKHHPKEEEKITQQIYIKVSLEINLPWEFRTRDSRLYLFKGSPYISEESPLALQKNPIKYANFFLMVVACAVEDRH